MEDGKEDQYQTPERELLARQIVDFFISREYEFVALIDLTHDTVKLERCRDNEVFAPPPEGTGCYSAEFKRVVPKLFFEYDHKRVLAEMSIKAVKAALEKEEQYICSFNVKTIDGVGRKQWRFTYLNRENGLVIYTRRDITDVYDTEIDPISGTYNRAAFFHYCERWLKKHPKTKAVMCTFDIDRFKLYNDRFGIAQGDALLAAMGGSVKQDTDRGFIYGRISADNFAILLPCDKNEVEERVSRRIRWIASFRPGYYITVHCGAYDITDRSLSPHAMYDRALLAKQSIKGLTELFFAWYVESMLQNLLYTQQLEQQISAGLVNGEFIPNFQPQFDHITGEMIGAEVLVRWVRPDGKTCPPSEFIPVMERTGEITKLDLILLEESCRLLAKWKENGYKCVPLSVNLSRRDLYMPGLNATICAILERYGIERSKIHLEITETACMENFDQISEALSMLRWTGFVIEMDDFGSGYSSLNTLKNMPVDIIKLDLKFLEDSINGRGGIILTAIVQMAHWLNLWVIVEGVETAQQAEYLKSIDCRFVQGFFYSRPLPASQFEELLLGQRCCDKAHDKSIAEFLNAGEFWDPNSQATIIFNTFVGAAGVFTFNGKELFPERLNEPFYRITGMPRDQIMERHNVMKLCVPESRQLVIDRLREAWKSGEEVSFESKWRISDAGISWFSARARCIARTASRCTLYLAAENITERINLEHSLKDQAKKIENIIASIPCGLVVLEVDKGGSKVTFVSEGLSKILLYSSEELMAEYNKDLFFEAHPDDAAEARDCLRRETSEGEAASGSSRYRYRSRRKDGKYIWVECTYNKVSDRGGTCVYYCALTDITEYIKQP